MFYHFPCSTQEKKKTEANWDPVLLWYMRLSSQAIRQTRNRVPAASAAFPLGDPRAERWPRPSPVSTENSVPWMGTLHKKQENWSTNLGTRFLPNQPNKVGSTHLGTTWRNWSNSFEKHPCGTSVPGMFSTWKYHPSNRSLQSLDKSILQLPLREYPNAHLAQ